MGQRPGAECGDYDDKEIILTKYEAKIRHG